MSLHSQDFQAVEILNQKAKIWHWIIDVIILFLISGVFSYLGSLKDIWFCDEVSTYESANQECVSLYEVFPFDEWVPGDEIQSFLSAETWHPGFTRIADELYKDHVPGYFWLFRMISILFMGSASKWIGLGINYAWLLLCFCILRKLFAKSISKISEEGFRLRAVPSLLSLVLIVHPLFLSEATTIRMYLMMTTVLFAFILCMENEPETIHHYLYLGCVTVVGLLTHYHFWLWIAFFSLLQLIHYACQKKWAELFRYCLTMAGSLLAVSVLFPQWIKNIFQDTETKGYSSFQKLVSGWSVQDLKAAWRALGTLINIENTVVAAVLFALVFFAYLVISKNRTAVKSAVCRVIISTLALSLIVIHTQPTEEERYLWMPFLLLFFSFLDMLFFLIFHLLKRTGKEKYSVAVTMSVIILLLCGNVYFSFAENSGNIRYLKNRPTSQHEAIQAERDIPWLVFWNSQSPDWVLKCSFYDFQIPEKVKKIDIEQEAYPDNTLRDEEEVIVYTNENVKSIDDCCKYIAESSGKTAGAVNKIGSSYSMSVYKVELLAQN